MKRENKKGVTIGIRMMIIIVIILISLAFAAMVAAKTKGFGMDALSGFKEFASNFIFD